MSDMVDDELLGGEDEIDDVYDITHEREEALLQEDEEYSKSRDAYDDQKKCESYSENEDQDDVLNLDIEEDFQDEDKLLYDDEEEEEPCKKIDVKQPVEKTQNVKPNLKTISNSTVRPPTTKPVPQTKKPYTAFQKVNNSKKNTAQNDNRKRGNGQRNFQMKNNFVKNRPHRRRNGTVLINPRYEGTVHVNENEARLAWNNTQYPQNSANFVQPWNADSTMRNCDVNLQSQLLVSNLVSGIANSIAQTPVNLLMPQSQTQSQHFFQSSSNNYEPPLSYEPPPNVVKERQLYNSYNNQNQVTSQVHHPPLQQSYARPIEQQPYGNQLPANRLPGDSRTYNSYSNYNRYDRTNNQFTGPTKNSNTTHSYDSGSPNYSKFNQRPSTYSNNYYTPQGGDNYERKNWNYSNCPSKQEFYNSDYNSGHYGSRNESVMRNEDMNYYGQQFPQKQPYADNNKFQKNYSQQGQIKRMENANITNKNFKQGYRRPITNNESTGFKDELPEKKIKVTENTSENSTKANEEVAKVTVTEKPQPTNKNVLEKETKEIEEENEETRLYRLKIEEQKREREKLLRIKEERRKQMMLQRQKQEEQKLPTSVSEGQNILKQNFQKNDSNNQPIKRDYEHSVGTIPVQKINRVTSGSVPNVIHRLGGAPQRQISRQNQNSTLSSNLSNYPRQTTNRSINSDSDLPSEFPNLTFKVSNDRQSNVSITNDSPKKIPNFTFKVDLHSGAPVVKELPKTEASSSSFMSNRVVVVKSKNAKSELLTSSDVSSPNEAANEPSDAGQGLSSFFNNRKVLKKDNNLLNTKLVVVNNLSATINQNKLMALSQGIGEIQQLRVDKQERQATILFKSVASAHAFYKKYQRRILDDLSVIEVKLEPML